MAELSELFIYREKGEETIDNLCVVYNDLFFFLRKSIVILQVSSITRKWDIPTMNSTLQCSVRIHFTF